jgi:hypothetical protein
LWGDEFDTLRIETWQARRASIAPPAEATPPAPVAPWRRPFAMPASLFGPHELDAAEAGRMQAMLAVARGESDAMADDEEPPPAVSAPGTMPAWWREAAARREAPRARFAGAAA